MGWRSVEEKGMKGVWWWSLPKEPQGCAPPAAGEHPLGAQGNPRGPGLTPPALCCPKIELRAAGPCPLPSPTCSILAAAVTSSPGKPRNDPINSSSLSTGCLVTTRSPSGAERFQLESWAEGGTGTSSQLMLSPLCHPLSCFRVCSLSWLICYG